LLRPFPWRPLRAS